MGSIHMVSCCAIYAVLPTVDITHWPHPSG
jgi:hypothetical protein